MMTASTMTRNDCFPDPTEEGGPSPYEEICDPEPDTSYCWNMFTQSLSDNYYTNRDETEEVGEESLFSKYACGDD